MDQMLSQLSAGPGAPLSTYGSIKQRVHDEAFSTAGRPKAHWLGFFDWLGRVGAEEYGRAASILDHRRAESGIAFAANGKTAKADSLPVILSPNDWHALEAGITQRANLIEAMLADVYGPGQMVRDGVIPPGLIFASEGYAAHCAQWEPPLQHWAYVYEADIARAADGRWIVLADRIDTPLGDGWLIANRIATSEALAEPFISLGVRRLASHYAAFQEYLEEMTGWAGRMGLVTGGEEDPRFFSHAYLARYLNAALIEPADITVRDGCAFVKTLDGLKKLDVLLRGVRDIGMDALHRPGSASRGAPALSLAMRSGQLILANAIGTSVLAYRGLAPYAHRLCEALLGEDLQISDAPCLWLGRREAREQVLAEREFWRIEPLNRRDRGVDFPVIPTKTDELRAMLERHGERFAAVATPKLAHTPCWENGQVVPGEWMMRVFACRTRDGWSLAPGGVASRVEPGRPPPDLDFGKDVWVLPDQSEREAATPILQSERFAGGYLRRTGRDLLSRVADELFWLGRNAERAESTLRILDVVLRRHLSGNRTDASPDVLCDLLKIKTERAAGAPWYDGLREAVSALMSSETETWGLPANLRALRSGSIRARSAISEESWRYVDQLCSDPRWQAGLDLDRPAELLRLISDHLGTLAAFAGSAHENLTRNYAWRFLEIGRRIERGFQTAGVAEQISGKVREKEETYLRAWLQLSDSSSAYRSRYMMTPVVPAVLDLLVLDESNPRSLAFQVEQLEDVLGKLPTDTHYRRPEHRKALALLTEFRLLDADVLAASDDFGDRVELKTLSKRCREDLIQISNLISQAFFAHADIAEALVKVSRAEGAK
ncbi:circularly permuted type 2 ATP-grasp protein [Rhodobacteraceae bacterium NNCM2]|nr:circularly permuted type 2 ATP-grasp protein [Coraliihabitans acroporae]